MAEEIILEEPKSIGIRFVLGGTEDTNGEMMGNEATEGDGTDIVWFYEFDRCHVGDKESLKILS